MTQSDRETLTAHARAATEMRRRYLAKLDDAYAERLASPSHEDDQRVQTLGALQRLFGELLTKEEEVIRVLHQLDRVEASAPQGD